MIHAIDYDDTFTAAPAFWSQVIELAESLGHVCYIVTARRDTEENREDVNAFLSHWGVDVTVFYTSLGSKIDFMRKRGITVSIWHDDDPVRLVHGH